MMNWIIQQLFKDQNQSKPIYAFQGTIFWMRALAILSQSNEFEHQQLEKYYEKIKSKKRTDDEKSIIYESLLLSLHNISSISALININKNPYDFARSAIISWYYSIYFSSSAMIAAVSGSFQEKHSKKITVFQNQIIDHQLAVGPFQISVNGIISKEVDNAILKMRKENIGDLKYFPETEKDAWGCIYSYLKGTTEFEREKLDKEILTLKEFKELGVLNFKTKKARELRNARLKKKPVNFLTESFRYRGKANYRDSIYLSYGENKSEALNTFISDLELVAKTYFRMTFALTKNTINHSDINNFSKDLIDNVKFSIDPSLLQM